MRECVAARHAEMVVVGRLEILKVTTALVLKLEPDLARVRAVRDSQLRGTSRETGWLAVVVLVVVVAVVRETRPSTPPLALPPDRTRTS